MEHSSRSEFGREQVPQGHPVKAHDNHGRLLNETNTIVTDSTVVATNPVYNSQTGGVMFHHISVRDGQDKISVRHIINGRLLP